MTHLTDPVIEVFDISANAGMGRYAQHSRDMALRSQDPRTVAMHKAVADQYDRADALLAEVETALAEHAHPPDAANSP